MISYLFLPLEYLLVEPLLLCLQLPELSGRDILLLLSEDGIKIVLQMISMILDSMYFLWDSIQSQCCLGDHSQGALRANKQISQVVPSSRFPVSVRSIMDDYNHCYFARVPFPAV